MVFDDGPFFPGTEALSIMFITAQLTLITVHFPRAISQADAKVSTLMAFPSLVGKTKELGHIAKPTAIKHSFETP